MCVCIDINKQDVFKIRDDVIPRINSIREKLLTYLSVYISFHDIVLTVQGSVKTRKCSLKITICISNNRMNL